jgi:hypothetical protein
VIHPLGVEDAIRIDTMSSANPNPSMTRAYYFADGSVRRFSRGNPSEPWREEHWDKRSDGRI